MPHKFFTCTLCHKSLLIFQEKWKHYIKTVNYSINEKEDLKPSMLSPCYLAISSHSTPKWPFYFCVHNPLSWEFLNHHEISLVQNASVFYFTTELLLGVSCFADYLKKSLNSYKIFWRFSDSLLNMLFMFLKLHQKLVYESDFSLSLLFLFQP